MPPRKIPLKTLRQVIGRSSTVRWSNSLARSFKCSKEKKHSRVTNTITNERNRDIHQNCARQEPHRKKTINQSTSRFSPSPSSLPSSFSPLASSSPSHIRFDSNARPMRERLEKMVITQVRNGEREETRTTRNDSAVPLSVIALPLSVSDTEVVKKTFF